MDKQIKIEQKAVKVLKEIFDPEIPVNIYDLGLIYKIDFDNNSNLNIDMTLTAPNCPMADDLVMQVNQKLSEIVGVNLVNINLTFDPPWDKNMLSEEAKLELGLL
ncbi:MAG TPA: iron-sulfur cluster assembly protein [Bacteroidales bacterium]|jgi:FeS assembly SUF system protein|nr:iron-sulfur cluster assembly protein [Bacteroidales bacterium]MDD4234481.1 iron-sulfur cluster assembly protein [Bacteroidales bacterium]MDY0159715.1 iron-sulfur cluster assembly protein [Bacteroidales bacterium]HRW20502.1 iron-sulfur cluster assembly protein [Bacteroidales bacterium]HXK80644.1 iron-sulfur cluster assembly protein [Bacteroidales bacterium]